MADDPLPGSVPLADPRHEKFAQAFAAGQTKAAAYKAAGFRPKHGNSAKAAAHRLFTKDDVRERVEFLKNSASRVAQDTLLNIARDSVITKELVKGMLLVQAQRNMGFLPVTIDVVDKKTGKVKSVTRTVYDPKAANVTLNMLGQEVGLFEGGSASQGEDGTDIDSRAAADSPHIIEEIEGLKAARRLVLAGGKDVEREASKVAIGAALKKLAGEK